jgi:soluble cytochrome b562
MSNRNLRRLAGKKNAGDLARVLHGLKDVAAGLKETVPQAQQELAAAQKAATEFREGFDDILYRIERQRMVFLRLLHDFMNPASDPDDLFALEASYTAEYDAMQFLVWVAMLGRGEEP